MTQRALIAGVGGHEPVIAPTAFVAPTSVVVGEVGLAAGSSVWYHTVLRADGGPIVIGADSNIQDNCTVHVDPGSPVTIGERVSVGHNAVLHGCTVEDDVLVGMGATVLNGAHIGAGSLVAAQALVPQGMRVPPGSLVAGVAGQGEAGADRGGARGHQAQRGGLSGAGEAASGRVRGLTADADAAGGRQSVAGAGAGSSGPAAPSAGIPARADAFFARFLMTSIDVRPIITARTRPSQEKRFSHASATMPSE